MTSQLEYT